MERHPLFIRRSRICPVETAHRALKGTPVVVGHTKDKLTSHSVETWLLFGHHRRPDIAQTFAITLIYCILYLSSSLSTHTYTRVCIRYIVKSVSPCLGARKNSISTLNFTKLHLARVKDVQSVDFRLLRRCLDEARSKSQEPFIARIYKISIYESPNIR